MACSRKPCCRCSSPLVLVLSIAGGRPEPASAPPRTDQRILPAAVLGYIGVLSHVAMDWLNTYGVRLLMPLSPQWFYGDAVFIVDPWLWLMFAAGVIARQTWLRRTRSPRSRLVMARLYIVAMILSARAARQLRRRGVDRGEGRAARAA